MKIVEGIDSDIDFYYKKENFELILRIFIQIRFFSSQAKDYSTYFYNLDLMNTKFFKKILNTYFNE